MKVLFLSRWFPYPADNGARLRIQGLLHHLASEATIDLISFSGGPVDEDRLQEGHRDCRKITVIPYRGFDPKKAAGVMPFLSLSPRSVTATYSPEMTNAVQGAVDSEEYDLVIASERDMVDYARRINGPPVLLEEMELASLYDAPPADSAFASRVRHTLMWLKTTAYYRRHIPGFAGITVVSQREESLLRSILPSYQSIRIIPNGICLDDYRLSLPDPKPNLMIYAGSLTYDANHDAVQYFAKQILPIVLEKHPDARLRITGSMEGVQKVDSPSNHAIDYTGYLADIRPAVASSWLSVIPLRKGGGTRFKILESLALGTPVVATRKGAEGLDLTPGREFLVADDPEEFAAQVCMLLGNTALRSKLSSAGRKRVAEYDWTNIMTQFYQFMNELIQTNGSTTTQGSITV